MTYIEEFEKYQKPITRMINLNILSRVGNEDKFELNRNFRAHIDVLGRYILENRKLQEKNKELSEKEHMTVDFIVAILRYLELDKPQYEKYYDKIYEMANIACDYSEYKRFQEEWK